MEEKFSFSGMKHEARRTMGVEFVFLSLFFGGLWAGPPANAPQREESRKKKQTECLFISFFLDGVK
jgi:hypothetical protein